MPIRKSSIGVKQAWISPFGLPKCSYNVMHLDLAQAFKATINTI